MSECVDSSRCLSIHGSDHQAGSHQVSSHQVVVSRGLRIQMWDMGSRCIRAYKSAYLSVHIGLS